MLGKIRKIWMASARRRILDKVRRQFETCGYTLDDLTDSQLEAAITRGEGGIETVPPLTAKTIYWMLRRLSPDGKLRERKIKQMPQTQRAEYL